MEKLKRSNLFVILVIGLFSLILFSEICNSNSRKLSLSAIDYSDELKHENYEVLESLDNWYDGIMTFYYDNLGEKPLELNCYQPVNTFIEIIDLDNHKNVLRQNDDSLTDRPISTYYFDVDFYENEINIEFWLRADTLGTPTGSWLFLDFYDNNSLLLFRFQVYNSLELITYGSEGGLKTIGGFSINVWHHFNIYFQYTSINTGIKLYWNKGYAGGWVEKNWILNISHFKFFSGVTGNPNNIYLDAFNINDNNINFHLKTQIRNIIPYPFSNYDAFTPNDLFSFYSSIIDKYPTLDNNYREYYIIDKIINERYIDKTRLLRKKGTEVFQNKYKVLQFYFDELNDSNAFRENKNQSLNVRIDSMDNSENLINKYFIELQFNKTEGFLTWKALYRKSLALPIWKTTPTNPIFKFSDYMPENTRLMSLQVNLHIFLSYINTTQKYIFIRTDICINDMYSMSYQYDKMIDGGNNAFYYSQDKLIVRFIDYFNMNNATDYLGNSYYTMNNLRGLRTLMLNSTDYKFNFLDAGYFKSELDYYVPPIPPTPDPQPDPPDEPDPPDDNMDFWKYESFKIKKNGYNTIAFSESVDFYNESVLIEYSLQFDLLESEQYTAKYYYNDELFSKKSLGNWELTLNIGLGDFIISFNWIRDIVRSILNGIILFFQFLLYLLVVAFNYLLMFLIMVLIVPFFWNYPIYWLVFLGIFIMFYVYVLFVWLLGLLWSFLIWIYEFILIPIFTFLLNDFLPIFLQILVIVIAWLLALIIWLTTFCQGDFDEIYVQTLGLTQTIVDFLVETLTVFVENIGSLLLYLIWFVMLIMFCYLKIIYCKAKGFVSRTEQLQESLNAYIFPFEKAKSLIITIKESVFRWS